MQLDLWRKSDPTPVARSSRIEKLKLCINISTLPERGRSRLRRSKLLLRKSLQTTIFHTYRRLANKK